MVQLKLQRNGAHRCIVDAPRLRPGLGTAALRVEVYRAIVRDSLPGATVEEIRLYLQQQRALGRMLSAAWSEPIPYASQAFDPLIAHESLSDFPYRQECHGCGFVGSTQSKEW